MRLSSISVFRNRFKTAFPNEPVPPVINSVLPLNIIVFLFIVKQPCKQCQNIANYLENNSHSRFAQNNASKLFSRYFLPLIPYVSRSCLSWASFSTASKNAFLSVDGHHRPHFASFSTSWRKSVLTSVAASTGKAYSKYESTLDG